MRGGAGAEVPIAGEEGGTEELQAGGGTTVNGSFQLSTNLGPNSLPGIPGSSYAFLRRNQQEYTPNEKRDPSLLTQLSCFRM